MTITLYHAPGACSIASYVSLLEAGAEFDVKLIILANKDQNSESYKALNPKQKVPYLTVDGKGLSENSAILTWIASTYPEAKLLPEDTFERARAISHMNWFSSGMHPHITRHFRVAKFCEIESAHEDIKAKAKAMFFEQIALVEQELEGRTWFFDHITSCDFYFFWVYDRGLRENWDLSEFSNCTAHYEAVKKLPNVQKALAHTQ
ncbi:MAG: glutathione S-transferase family protein [Rhodobacteraceae bacterium]|nr:glutathione S-transferase family protein [Paracoccaceae bacterium]